MIPATAQSFHISSPHAVKLASSNPEYEAILDVVGNVDHPQEGFKFSIESIFRVQNAQLAEEYLLYKQNLSKVLRQEELHETRLYHGTPSIGSVQGIINEGFDWRLCGKHGTQYGKGAYFSRTPRYSLRNFTKPDGSGFRYLFVSRVLLGKPFEGNPSMVRPPEGYHCTVDQLPNANIAVVYHIKQTYPEYLVVLKERPIHGIEKFRSHSFLDNFVSQGQPQHRGIVKAQPGKINMAEAAQQGTPILTFGRTGRSNSGSSPSNNFPIPPATTPLSSMEKRLVEARPDSVIKPIMSPASAPVIPATPSPCTFSAVAGHSSAQANSNIPSHPTPRSFFATPPNFQGVAFSIGSTVIQPKTRGKKRMFIKARRR
uniref:Poly [ADP-ribose] polymerase n=1 Tax=Heterosigma akashiwo TaxID=2829 RepID=A0A7S3XSI9_HETAK